MILPAIQILDDGEQITNASLALARIQTPLANISTWAKSKKILESYN